MKLKFASLAAWLVCSLAVPAHAQFAKPEDAMKYRKSALFVMAQNFGRVAAMASGKAPFDAQSAAENAAAAAAVAKLPWAAFTPDSDMGDTKAKAEVWSKRAKFDELAKQLTQEMAKVEAAAKGGKLADIKVAVAATGKVCKACHDDYREK
jgi:cytochrome c556